MDDLTLPSALILVWDVKKAIENNRSIHTGLENYIQRDLKCKFHEFIKNWVESKKLNKTIILKYDHFTIYQRVLFDLIQKGIDGVSIYENIIELNDQMLSICDEDIEKHVALLPLKLQIPLLGLLFPAILMILIVPALKMLSFK